MCSNLTSVVTPMLFAWYLQVSETGCRERTDAECSNVLGLPAVWRGTACLVLPRADGMGVEHCPTGFLADAGVCVRVWGWEPPTSLEECTQLHSAPVLFNDSQCIALNYTHEEAPCPIYFVRNLFTNLCEVSCLVSSARGDVASVQQETCRQLSNEECTEKLGKEAVWDGQCNAIGVVPSAPREASEDGAGFFSSALGAAPFAIAAITVLLVLLVGVGVAIFCVAERRARVCVMSAFLLLSSTLIGGATYEVSRRNDKDALLYATFLIAAWIVLAFAMCIVCFASAAHIEEEVARRLHAEQNLKTEKEGEEEEEEGRGRKVPNPKSVSKKQKRAPINPLSEKEVV